MRCAPAHGNSPHLIAERNSIKFCTKKPHTQRGSSSERDYNINPTLGGAGERERPLRKRHPHTVQHPSQPRGGYFQIPPEKVGQPRCTRIRALGLVQRCPNSNAALLWDFGAPSQPPSLWSARCARTAARTRRHRRPSLCGARSRRRACSTLRSRSVCTSTWSVRTARTRQTMTDA